MTNKTIISGNIGKGEIRVTPNGETLELNKVEIKEVCNE